MPVNADQLQISPYTSTVPMVQIPPDQLQAETTPAPPLQGQFGGKHGQSTRSLAIGDALLKGFMEGHQKKQADNYAKAQATISAADAATEAAYQKYQTALSQAGGRVDDPSAKAAYDAYQGVFGQAKQAKAAFVIPQKESKGKKGGGPLSKDTDPAKSPDKQKGGGMMGGIKDFLAANPHIVPQIALLTMQPKPQGLSPEGQEQQQRLLEGKQKLDSEQIVAANKKTYQDGYAQFAGLDPEQIKALPPDVKKQYDAWVGAKAALTPMNERGSRYRYTLPSGEEAMLYPDEAEQIGAKLAPKGTASKLGSMDDFIATTARDNKMEAGKFSAGQKGYLDQLWHFYQQNPTASENVSWYIDDKGNWQTRTAPGYRGPIPPKPQAGLFPKGFTLPGQKIEGQVVPGGMTKPPQRTATKPAATGALTAPPQHGKPPMRSWQAAQNTQKVETEQKDRYAKAETAFSAKLKTAQGLLAGGKIDQTTYDRQVAQAHFDLDDEKKQIEKWYADQVHAVQGTVPADSFNWNSFPTAQ